MKTRMQILRKVASRSALGILLAAFVLCVGTNSARAATARPNHGKNHAARKSESPSKAHQATLRNTAYKTSVHKRRRRRRRHHITLPKAPSAERTHEIQSALQRGGYYAGVPTGKWDATTQESLRRFQEANGLPPTGKLDAISLQKMGLGSDVAGVSAPRAATPGNSANSTVSPTTATPKTPGQ